MNKFEKNEFVEANLNDAKFQVINYLRFHMNLRQWKINLLITRMYVYTHTNSLFAVLRWASYII